jgi:hypothetical protein
VDTVFVSRNPTLAFAQRRGWTPHNWPHPPLSPGAASRATDVPLLMYEDASPCTRATRLKAKDKDRHNH